MEELFTLGYRGKNDLEQSRLKFIKSEDSLSAALNKVKTHQANRRKLADYEFKMQKLTLEGAVATAERARRQVENDNTSLLEQALAAKDEASLKRVVRGYPLALGLLWVPAVLLGVLGLRRRR